MSSNPRGRSPLVEDLEKELVCSVCTDLLYQPLTLLDCLHTFCALCIKEWFAVQHSRRRSSSGSSSPRFTCPSCRAAVRETRHNATVTTLLDMFLATNPDRAKPVQEKEEIAKKYKPGDSVFPIESSSSGSESESDAEDRGVLEEVRQLSLQESRAGTGRRHVESSHTEGRVEDGRSRRRHGDDHEGRRHARQRTTSRIASAPTHDVLESSRNARLPERQSSLRSLLSLSDTETMEEEILRQILEEGLLDGINLDSLSPAQEEELSERIADVYRRRHRHRSRARRETHEPQQSSQNPSPRPRASSQLEQRPVTAPAPASRQSRHLPTSRPHLLEPPPTRSGFSSHHRQLSDQPSRQRRISPVHTHHPSSSETMIRPAARSSSDMTSDRLRLAQEEEPRAATGTRDPPFTTRPRRATESEHYRNALLAGARGRASSQQQTQTNNRATTSSSTPSSPLVTTSPYRNFSPTRSDVAIVSASVAPGGVSPISPNNHSRPSSSSHSPHTTLYREPSISCERCGKMDIQYEIYKNCPKCKDGNYNICLRCSRLGVGCLHWSGYGVPYGHQGLFLHRQPAQRGEAPHVLFPLRYQRPPVTARRTVSEDKQMTNNNPASRVQSGLFCDICQSSANDCFWKCTQCNEGDWGFCRRCVNQGKCCTHALLPICRVLNGGGDYSRSGMPSSTASTHQVSIDRPTTQETVTSFSNDGNETYKTLSISTKCDICTCPIPASMTRFHCLECNEGDYDICANCYFKLVATGKISKEHGHNGWRRCLRGHRMVVIGFEDYEEGQKRVIIRGLVGGYTLKDEYALRQQQQQQQHAGSASTSSTSLATSSPNSSNNNNINTFIPSPELGSGDWSWKEGSERRKKASRVRSALLNNANSSNSDTSPSSPTTPTFNGNNNNNSSNSNIIHSRHRRFPPDGGVGLIVHARWSWFPEDDIKDELMFPRGAEITEAENVNDDWFWGCYAGITGLFPGGHVVVVGEVV